MKKKKYRFGIQLDLIDLTSVPYVNGSFFTKLRLVDGGDFTHISARAAVANHRVIWEKKFSFVCKMHSSPTSGVLESCILRLSVRKDGKAGKIEKLGHVDMNLAEFAGAGVTEKRYILQSYDSDHRVDNSILRLKVLISLQEGDPLFKRPTPEVVHPTDLSESRGGARATAARILPEGHESGLSISDSSISLAESCTSANQSPSSATPTVSAGSSTGSRQSDMSPVCSRSASSQLRVTGPLASGHDTIPRVHNRASTRQWLSATSHRRNVSWDSARLGEMVRDTDLKRDSVGSEGGLSANSSTRVSSTRIDASGIVNEVMSSMAGAAGSSTIEETSGLQLLVRRDGTATVSGRKSDRYSAPSRATGLDESR